MKSGGFTISNDVEFKSMGVQVVDDTYELLLEGIVNLYVEVVEFGVNVEFVADGHFLVPVVVEGMCG